MMAAAVQCACIGSTCHPNSVSRHDTLANVKYASGPWRAGGSQGSAGLRRHGMLWIEARATGEQQATHTHAGPAPCSGSIFRELQCLEHGLQAESCIRRGADRLARPRLRGCDRGAAMIRNSMRSSMRTSCSRRSAGLASGSPRRRVTQAAAGGTTDPHLQAAAGGTTDPHLQELFAGKSFHCTQ